jgi:hypothetical protein
MRSGGKWIGRLGFALLLATLPGLALAQGLPRGIEPREIPDGTYKITLVQIPAGSYALVLEPAGAPPLRVFGGRRRTLTQTKEWAVNSIRIDLGTFFAGLVPGPGGAAAAYVLYPPTVTATIESSSAAGITLVFEDRGARGGGGG